MSVKEVLLPAPSVVQVGLCQPGQPGVRHSPQSGHVGLVTYPAHVQEDTLVTAVLHEHLRLLQTSGRVLGARAAQIAAGGLPPHLTSMGSQIAALLGAWSGEGDAVRLTVHRRCAHRDARLRQWRPRSLELLVPAGGGSPPRLIPRTRRRSACAGVSICKLFLVVRYPRIRLRELEEMDMCRRDIPEYDAQLCRLSLTSLTYWI